MKFDIPITALYPCDVCSTLSVYTLSPFPLPPFPSPLLHSSFSLSPLYLSPLPLPLSSPLLCSSLSLPLPSLPFPHLILQHTLTHIYCTTQSCVHWTMCFLIWCPRQRVCYVHQLCQSLYLCKQTYAKCRMAECQGLLILYYCQLVLAVTIMVPLIMNSLAMGSWSLFSLIQWRLGLDTWQCVSLHFKTTDHCSSASLAHCSGISCHILHLHTSFTYVIIHINNLQTLVLHRLDTACHVTDFSLCAKFYTPTLPGFWVVDSLPPPPPSIPSFPPSLPLSVPLLPPSLPSFPPSLSPKFSVLTYVLHICVVTACLPPPVLCELLSSLQENPGI